jgi:hypothetical protein
MSFSVMRFRCSAANVRGAFIRANSRLASAARSFALAASARASSPRALKSAIRWAVSDCEISDIWYPTMADIKAELILIPPATAAVIVAQKNTDCQKDNGYPSHISFHPLPFWPFVFFFVSMWVCIVGFIYLQLCRYRKSQRRNLG